MKISDFDKNIGIENYFTPTPGIGGKLRSITSDFVVEEISGNNELQTIEAGPFFKKTSQFSKTDPTVFATLVKCGLSTIEVKEELSRLLSLKKEAI